METLDLATVHLVNRKHFEALENLSVLDAAKSAGVVLEHSCRTGRCGTCKAQVTAGSTEVMLPEASLHDDEKAAGWILTCARSASSDLWLDVEDLGLLADMPVKTLPCRIDTLERVAPDVLKVVLRLPPNNGFRHLAGQYIDVIAKGGQRRSYSIANDGNSGRIELHVREVPGGTLSTYWFNEAKTNDLLRFEGPRGTFFLRDLTGKHLVFLATGTGIAPIAAMLGSLAAMPATKPASVTVYWGGRVASDLYWQPGTDMPELRFVPVLSRADAAWTGARGHVQNVFLAEAPALEHTVVYACGSDLMIEDARRSLQAAGLSAKSFFADAFVSSSHDLKP
jgi:CDP-4-dehydro-6-deoxyglucose reductase